MTKPTPREQVIESLFAVLTRRCANVQPCPLCRIDAKAIARSRLLRITLAPKPRAGGKKNAGKR